jgi:DNA-binding PucR family transcriptional regulator
MDPIALAAATALVAAMATDAWQEARTAVVAWWRRNHPRHSRNISQELESARSDVLAARDRGVGSVQQCLTNVWQQRFQQVLDFHSTSRQELQQLIDEHLTSILPPADRNQVRQIIHLNAQDQARQYVAGRDQNISG